MSDPLNHLGSIWYPLTPLDVPYSPNQFLGRDFFCRFLQQTGSSGKQPCCSIEEMALTLEIFLLPVTDFKNSMRQCQPFVKFSASLFVITIRYQVLSSNCSKGLITNHHHSLPFQTKQAGNVSNTICKHNGVKLFPMVYSFLSFVPYSFISY